MGGFGKKLNDSFWDLILKNYSFLGFSYLLIVSILTIKLMMYALTPESTLGDYYELIAIITQIQAGFLGILIPFILILLQTILSKYGMDSILLFLNDSRFKSILAVYFFALSMDVLALYLMSNHGEILVNLVFINFWGYLFPFGTLLVLVPIFLFIFTTFLLISFILVAISSIDIYSFSKYVVNKINVRKIEKDVLKYNNDFMYQTSFFPINVLFSMCDHLVLKKDFNLTSVSPKLEYKYSEIENLFYKLYIAKKIDFKTYLSFFKYYLNKYYNLSYVGFDIGDSKWAMRLISKKISKMFKKIQDRNFVLSDNELDEFIDLFHKFTLEIDLDGRDEKQSLNKNGLLFIVLSYYEYIINYSLKNPNQLKRIISQMANTLYVLFDNLMIPNNDHIYFINPYMSRINYLTLNLKETVEKRDLNLIINTHKLYLFKLVYHHSNGKNKSYAWKNIYEATKFYLSLLIFDLSDNSSVVAYLLKLYNLDDNAVHSVLNDILKSKKIEFTYDSVFFSNSESSEKSDPVKHFDLSELEISKIANLEVILKKLKENQSKE
ncbi:hypothetical protein Mevan_1654 [Methanococcus vannielii SB]|uniref:Uncharacterized protein n=1 Tax=Methanococcus vannielii (strain ATCC 35089 / DSM 1224 / JCM 13029 / OCM 148 / SB) TaxID=406327 RepID=A6USS4_METVS|nr:hypothetical protein [Methanococcus vannielii]ABR55546.1 hypothetical protein Mevan_1654 [Methanococcus vannielii SB]